MEQVETVMFGKQSAFGRPAQPVEQAVICVFLASDDASYVTGEVYGATGTGRRFDSSFHGAPGNPRAL